VQLVTVCYEASVDDLDADNACKERGVFEHVVPRHAHAAQGFGAAEARQVAAPKLDALGLHLRERCLTEHAALEQHVVQLSAIKVELLQPAVAEDNAFELRQARGRQVETAADEAHVAEGRLRQVGARQADRVQLNPQEARPGHAPVCPVGVTHDDIGQTSLEIRFFGLLGEIRGIGLERGLGHVAEGYGRGHTVAMTRVALMGATGSIGRQALEVIAARPELELVAATSGSTPIDGLAPLTQVGGDPSDLLERAAPDIVLNATLGFAGLPATMWALERGVTLALANKESLVAAGDLALAARERGGGALLPVDSEHSALFQCAQLGDPESIVVTASGGPFRGRTRDELADVTPEEALAHPTWSMGAKITIDSATLANKGLEVIEAHFLFGLPYDRIEVVVHPTSIVHGLVRFRDGAAIAHLGYPDMRVPISYALTYPERAETPVPSLDLTAGPLEFFEPDIETFRMLALARDAGERGGTYPCAYNAANEEAVGAFLDGRIGFLDIAALVEEALAGVDGAPAHDLDELREADRRARELVGAAWA
jgi:1-deoxy-D-xylulose-5-phosphate reductoisomerase